MSTTSRQDTSKILLKKTVVTILPFNHHQLMILSEATSQVSTSSTDDVSEPELVIPTRPSQIRRPPKRFDDYVAIGGSF